MPSQEELSFILRVVDRTRQGLSTAMSGIKGFAVSAAGILGSIFTGYMMLRMVRSFVTGFREWAQELSRTSKAWDDWRTQGALAINALITDVQRLGKTLQSDIYAGLAGAFKNALISKQALPYLFSGSGFMEAFQKARTDVEEALTGEQKAAQQEAETEKKIAAEQKLVAAQEGLMAPDELLTRRQRDLADIQQEMDGVNKHSLRGIELRTREAQLLKEIRELQEQVNRAKGDEPLPLGTVSASGTIYDEGTTEGPMTEGLLDQAQQNYESLKALSLDKRAQKRIAKEAKEQDKRDRKFDRLLKRAQAKQVYNEAQMRGYEGGPSIDRHQFKRQLTKSEQLALAAAEQKNISLSGDEKVVDSITKLDQHILDLLKAK